jgi:O-antigen ligase
MYTQGYTQGKVLPTLIDDDHIRFSWCVVIAILFSLHQHFEIQSKRLQIINFALAIWLIFFLHILGSKTGWLFFYGALLIYLIQHFKKIKRTILISLTIGVLLMPILFYHTLPTFKKRIDFIAYDFSFYKKGIYKEGLSDGVRMASVQAAVSITANNLITGVGYGDIKEKTNNWYALNVPQMLDYEKILPSSQFLLVSAASGLIGLAIFLISLLLPFWDKVIWKNTYFCMFYIGAIGSFVFDIPLDGQNSVFVFSFFTWWFVLLGKQKKPPKN